MNETFAPRSTASSVPATWSTRLLLLALMGILFLTLFPFRFALHAHLPANRSPFLLGGWGKDANPFNIFLNILLFVPFGFAVSEKYRERGSTRATTLIWIVALGALLSYSIELLQLHIPLRDSGWEDVITNSIGSAAGFIVYELFGQTILRCFITGERTLGALKLPQGAAIISIYFLLWFAISIPMQRQMQLNNWDPNALLLLGNDDSGRALAAWKGTVFRLQIWDHALSQTMVQRLTAPGEQERVQSGLLADYTFSAPSRFLDRMNFLPELGWTSNAPDRADPRHDAILDGSSWLASKLPVSNLVAALRGSNQFAIRVVCSPAAIEGADGRIVSISRHSGPVDLQIRQEGASLVFWFRSPLSVKRSLLAWHVPDVFTLNQPSDILFSYDGADLSLFLAGKLDSPSYRLGPGVSLARIARLVRPQELSGYNFIYYSLLFFPAGALLGIAARRVARRNLAILSFTVLGFLLPSLLFEFILVRVSGRPVSLSYIVLSVILTVAGCLWINADRRFPAAICDRFPAVPG